MKKSSINNRISRVFIGSIIWLAYFLYAFSHETLWDATLFQSITNLAYSTTLAYVIASVFFAFAGYNLYRSSLSKSQGSATLQNFLHVLIVALIVKLLVQFFVYEYGGLYAFYGLIGMLVTDEYALGEGSILLFYQFFQLLYITLVILFIYQLKKARVTLSSMNKFKFMIVLIIYTTTLMLNTPVGLNLFISAFYIILALMIYKKTKYNLALPLTAIMILILI